MSTSKRPATTDEIVDAIVELQLSDGSDPAQYQTVSERLSSQADELAMLNRALADVQQKLDTVEARAEAQEKALDAHQKTLEADGVSMADMQKHLATLEERWHVLKETVEMVSAAGASAGTGKDVDKAPGKA